MRMKIVFMGTPDFAAHSLRALIEGGYEVAAVYTQPDKPVGRKQTLTAPPVKQLALEHSIEVYQPIKLRDGTVAQQLRAIAPDIIIVVAYGRILPREILEIPPMGCVNLHGSLLPKYRGAAPIQWAVINGESESGVTTMFMGEGLDTGDMLLKASTPIRSDETAGELFERLGEIGARCLLETLEGLKNGSITPQAQNEDEATYAPMLDKELAQLDFKRPAGELVNLIRGLNPWPIALAQMDGKRLKIYAAEAVEGAGNPGEVIDAQEFIVACGSGALRLTDVQLEGSKRMSAREFLRGRTINVGKMLIGR